MKPQMVDVAILVDVEGGQLWYWSAVPVNVMEMRLAIRPGIKNGKLLMASSISTTQALHPAKGLLLYDLHPCHRGSNSGRMKSVSLYIYFILHDYICRCLSALYKLPLDTYAYSMSGG